MSKCLTCDSEKADPRIVRYFSIPGYIMVPNSYVLCPEHKDLQYYFEDIYDENGKRKTINHEAVKERNKND